MKEISPQEYQAIEEFADGLTTCFIHYKNTHNEEFSNIVLNYVIQIIDIHLQLADLEVGMYLNNMAKEFEKKS